MKTISVYIKNEKNKKKNTFRVQKVKYVKVIYKKTIFFLVRQLLIPQFVLFNTEK